MNKHSDGKDFFGIVTGVLAAVIFIMVFCVVVWNVTHREVKSGLANNDLTGKDEIVLEESKQESPTQNGEADATQPSSDNESEEQEEDENSLGMEFDEMDEYVTAKDVTNLRSEPSTSQGEATVVAKLKNGISAKRTGINEATGWSRLEYNGQVVYAVSQYLLNAEDATEE